MPTINGLFFTERSHENSPYPPIVLVHGAGGSHLDWPPELRRLPQARVIALDLPGHGRSAGPGFDDTLEYARSVCTLLDGLNIERAVIVGHSMGGAIAQQIGIFLPARAAGLVLVGTGSKLPVEPTLPQRILDDPEGTVDWIAEWAWSADAPTDVKTLGRQRLLAVPPKVLRRDYLACQAFDVRESLGLITTPVLVLGATEDRMVKLKFSTYLAENIPNATLVVVDGAGHMFPLEKAQVVASAVSDWLAAQEWDR
ncbi:MAG: alpha/beta hydrolase [Chloroflexi bacterium]|nr:alpha/beta hydrolase [Chloroflexota bacterium]